MLLSRGGGGGSLGPSLPQARCGQTARGCPRLGGASVKLWKRGGLCREQAEVREGGQRAEVVTTAAGSSLVDGTAASVPGVAPDDGVVSHLPMKVSTSEPPAPRSELQLLPLPAGHSSRGGGSHQWAIPLPHSPASSGCLINVGYTELGFLEA